MLKDADFERRVIVRKSSNFKIGYEAGFSWEKKPFQCNCALPKNAGFDLVVGLKSRDIEGEIIYNGSVEDTAVNERIAELKLYSDIMEKARQFAENRGLIVVDETKVRYK
jgi:hypothetical protein